MALTSPCRSPVAISDSSLGTWTSTQAVPHRGEDRVREGEEQCAVGQQVEDRGQLRAPRLGVDLVPDRMLHPRVRRQDEVRRGHRSQRDHPDAGGVHGRAAERALRLPSCHSTPRGIRRIRCPRTRPSSRGSRGIASTHRRAVAASRRPTSRRASRSRNRGGRRWLMNLLRPRVSARSGRRAGCGAASRAGTRPWCR